jgi:outer membrane protein TolC
MLDILNVILDAARLRRARTRALLLAVTTATTALGQGARASAAATDLDSLVARALAVSPQLRAANRRVDAARARIGPAGALPDPMLMAGIQNLPLGKERDTGANGAMAASGPDPMTMRMVGLSQTIPYPGKRNLRTQTAQREVDVALAAVRVTQADVGRRVRDAFFELAYVDQALAIAERQRAVLTDVQRVADARYQAGGGSQQDVLRAGVELARLVDETNALVEQRRVQVAALNALLDRPTDTPIGTTTLPSHIARAAVADSAGRIRFTTQNPDARVVGSPIPSLDALQAMAMATSPMLREHEARIATQTARVTVAEKDRLPDFDVALQYGQRPVRPDMVTATVSLPLPIQRSRKQDQGVAEARAELAALEAEHHAQLLELRAEVARLHTELERSRTQLGLYVTAIIPQGRLVLAASATDFQTGKGDLRALLENQSTLFTYETTYYRTLIDFAKRLAELEQVVGKEILP